MSSGLLDILVIEGELPARDAVSTALAGLDLSIRFASGREDAIFEVKARAPDLLILDIASGGLDVIAFLDQLRVVRSDVPHLLLFVPSAVRSAPPAILGLAELHDACVAAIGRHGSRTAFRTWRAQQADDAGLRIDAERRRLAGLGVLDAAGNATRPDLPEDMRAGSKSDVTT